ncbi:MAG: hypothetical protein QOG10_307, partial [Kribbellaceae bacterium]|nr:hypothetical protein [Kribbellaceae bacterium]
RQAKPERQVVLLQQSTGTRCSADGPAIDDGTLQHEIR